MVECNFLLGNDKVLSLVQIYKTIAILSKEF